MAKDPQDELMPFTKLKQFLGHAEAEPRGCALALTKDRKDMFILIGDKSAKPKKVASIMKKKIDGEFDPNLLRFGRVSFDMERDKGTVRFDLNKNPAGGMIALTVKLMKKAGYESAVFNELPSLEDEGEEDIPDAPPPPPVQPVIDADALKKRLTALVQRIPGVLAADPTRKEALLALAKKAQLMLGTNNLKAATQSTDELEAALGPALPGVSVPPPPPPPPGTPQPPTAVTYAKSRLAWLAARQRVVGEVAKLRGQLLAEYKDAPESVEILDAYDTRSADLLAGFDEQLADKLDEVTNAEDAALRTKLVAEARTMIAGYQKHLESEKLIADLDENPFVPLTIRATMGATLTALAAAIH